MNKEKNIFYKLQGETIVGVKTVKEYRNTPGLGLSTDQTSVDRLLSTNLNMFGLTATISTVFIGQDVGDETDELPVLFETMIFSEIKELNYKFQDRYSKLSEAITGHSKMILIASAFLKNHALEMKEKEATR